MSLTHTALVQSRHRSRKRRPRAPAALYAVITMLLVVLTATLALTSRTSSPPTIAEFAPRAVEQITDAASGASGASRSASDDEAARDAADRAANAQAGAVDVARVRNCVGDPPRQIEDPQSPPCVPYWSGDNGGATSHGVTRDEIRVVVTNYNQVPNLYPALEAFFNKRFEFYGRRMRLMYGDYPGRGGHDPAPHRAAAQAAYSQHKAFASTGPTITVYDYFDELARLGIVGVDYSPAFPEKFLASRRPYLWTYPMADDDLFALTGDWYCSRLAGRNARFAGDPALQLTPRKPGIILQYAGGEGTTGDSMNEQLARCGAHAETLRVDDKSFPPDQGSVQNAILRMKTSGVTTLACLCYFIYPVFIQRAATNQGYFPEWIFTTYIWLDINGVVQLLGAQEQTDHVLGLTVQPMQRIIADDPAAWAYQEGRGSPGVWDSAAQSGADMSYRAVLLLASGLQMAGPNLTPESFERGLHQTRFPNPPHRIMAGSVGFNDGDHSMTDDAAEIWWSNAARDPFGGGVGAFCHVDHGARRRMGEFGTDEPFFTSECDSGAA